MKTLNYKNLLLVIVLPPFDLEKLLREDNGALGKTYVYTYDNAGNITSKKTYSLTAAGVTPTSPELTYSYGYSASGWGDMLTSYRDQSITYDALGNPLSYYNGYSYTFSWTGRQLTGASFSGNTYTFVYNDEGIRTSKTKNGVTTTYYLNGAQIVGEETGGNVTVYLYDSSGLPIGMQYHGVSYAANVWDIYWFEKNLQGDIIAVYDQAGNKLISYTYDAWGNVSAPESDNTTVANNPFRYRGYYYDHDLGLYYLNTRYYDSKTGRFISPDTEAVITATPDALTDKNLYAYCDNNPVSYVDHTGEFPWHILIGAAVGGIIGAVSSALSGGDVVDVIIGSVSGMASGALTASGVGVAGQVLGSASISMISNAADQVKNIVSDDTGETRFDVGDMLFDGAVSAATAYWGQNGASYGNTAGINASWNQLSKKGVLNSNARKYFYKTAHNSSGEFVLTSLAKSTVKNTVGTGVIAFKNWMRGILG